MIDFNKRVDEYRKRAGLSVRGLAQKVGVSPGHMYKLLAWNGGKGGPSREMIGKLATALELTDFQRDSLIRSATLPIDVDTERLVSDMYQFREPHEAGIVGVHSKLTNSLREELIWRSKGDICILDTWITDPFRFKSAFSKASLNGSNIFILLLAPKSEASIKRSRDLGYDNPNFVTNQINMNKDEFAQWADPSKTDPKINIHVRIYDSLSIMLHVFGGETTSDARILFSHYLHIARSDYAPQFEVKGGSELGQVFIREFRHVWDSIPQEDWLVGNEKIIPSFEIQQNPDKS